MNERRAQHLLILSNENDLHALAVVEALGERVLVLNPQWDATDGFLAEWSAAGGWDAKFWDDRIDHYPSRPWALWYRRPFREGPPRHSHGLDYFVMRERDDLLDVILRCWEAEGIGVYNRPAANYVASNKPLQLKLATGVGLDIPATLLTNSAHRAREFLQSQGQVIAKGVSLSGAHVGDTAWSVFVNEYEEFDATIDELLHFCPVTLQAAVQWAHAWRVIVCNERVWAFRIERGSSIDWRIDSSLPTQPMLLPKTLSRKLVRLVGVLGLRFAAIDLLQDAEGEFYFLEANPNGQWLWLEHETGYPLALEFGRELTRDLS